MMVKVLGAKENASMVANFASSLNINLDSYCTRHMTPCYELQNPKPCDVNIMVGNKEVLKSTHSGTLRLGNIVKRLVHPKRLCCFGLPPGICLTELL